MKPASRSWQASKSSSADQRAVLLDALKKLQPALARINFPKLLRNCQKIQGLPPRLTADIEALLPRPSPEYVDFPVQALNLAEVYRVLGNDKLFKEWLTKAGLAFFKNEAWLPLLQIIHSGQRTNITLPPRLKIAAAVKQFLYAFEGYPMLCGAILIEHADYLFDQKDYESSGIQLDKAWQYLSQDGESVLNRWMVRVEDLRARLAHERGDKKKREEHKRRFLSYLVQLIGYTDFVKRIANEVLEKSGGAETATPSDEQLVDEVERISSEFLTTIQRGFVMNADNVRKNAFVIQVLQDKVGTLIKPEAAWKPKERRPTAESSPVLKELSELGPDDPFSYMFLKRTLANWTNTGEELGRLFLTKEDVAGINDASDHQKLDLRLEIPDERLAALPWELLQFPEKRGDFVCLSERLRFFYRAPFTEFTKDKQGRKVEKSHFTPVGEVRWLQKSLKKIMPGATKNLEIDGVYATETKKAVRKFQRSQPLLLEDGKAGPVTKKTLKQVLRKHFNLGPPRVLLLHASVDREQEASRGGRRQGFDLADRYEKNGFDVKALENPTIEHLGNGLQSQLPEIVHICATMKLAPSVGIYLDFVSEKSKKSDGHIADELSFFSFSALSNQLNIFTDSEQPRPILILDIARPPGITEILRQLFMRNAFASRLLRQGSASAIIATGLGTFEDQEEMCDLLIKNLVTEEPLGYLVREVQGHAKVPALAAAKFMDIGDASHLEKTIPFIGTALFTDNPFY